jgi:RNA polymerase sigma-70 factor (ECF subfamily)
VVGRGPEARGRPQDREQENSEIAPLGSRACLFNLFVDLRIGNASTITCRGRRSGVIAFERQDRTAEGVMGAIGAEELQMAYVYHGGNLLSRARRSLGDRQLAEDVVQETFVRAWRSRGTFNGELGTIRGWLFAIERRVIIDVYRKRPSPPDLPIEEDPVTPMEEIESAMRGWQVEEAIRRLTPEHRYVVVHTYFGRYSSQELAKNLGVPEGTVRSRLFYALRSLRLTMDEMGWEP